MQWQSKIATITFRQAAYHTVFFVDLYLSPNEQHFVCDVQPRAVFLLAVIDASRDIPSHLGELRPRLPPRSSCFTSSWSKR